MSFNFGVANTGMAQSFTARMAYLYESTAYRRWITDIALAFYEGRQDEFVWYDLQRQFRHPDKQQIIPYNITREIIEETAILYREEPIYTIKDSEGKVLKEDTKLWARIRKDARYHSLCQKLDAMTTLLGTVLVRVTFIDPETGDHVNENKPGVVNFELVYGGSYDTRWNSSPYFLSELTFNYTQSPPSMGNMGVVTKMPINPNLTVAMKPGQGNSPEKRKKVKNASDLSMERITQIYWDLKEHRVEDADGNYYTGENPYGCIPAVPFFNQDPGNKYFLPVNEPLLYSNHAINMRLSDLNHIAKFQSFGQAVVKGIERPINNRLGRPVDDFNVRSGSRSFGFGSSPNSGPTGLDRNFNNPFSVHQDGNALPNMNGFSLGPDTLVSVGETGEFKFENPGADIKGLVSTIYTMMDMVRINHGLRAKHESKLPPSGFAVLAEKVGVVERNKRRSVLFKEREQQLFEIVKRLWNTHHAEEKGTQLFSEDSELDVHYIEPEFVTDPISRINALKQEQEIVATGDTAAIKKLYPHLDDNGVADKIAQFHLDKMEQAERDVEHQNFLTDNIEVPEGAEVSMDNGYKKSNQPKIQNQPEHSKESSVQPGKNGDTRKTNKTRRKETSQ
jgi:hypothetical protein